jgi:hypothetical protein
LAELESLTISLNDAFSAGANAVAAAADKMAAAMDKAAGSNTTTDTALRTRGQSLDGVTAKIDGAAAATSRLEQVERRYQAQVQVLTAGMTAQGKSAGEIADAIARLGVIRDQDAAKARAQGQAIEQRFAPAAAATDKLAASTRGGAMALRDMAMQGQDLFVQLASGGNIFTALIQQGSQVAQQMMAAGQGFGALKSAASIALGAILSPMGLLVTGAAAATAAIASMVAAGNTQLGMLAEVQQSLRGAQDNYEALGQTVVDVGRKVSQSSGLGLDDAVQAAKTIAQGRYFAGTAADLERLTRDAQDFGTKLGGVAAGAKFIADAMLDPAKAAQSAGEALKVYLDPELVKNIELTQTAYGKGAAWIQLLGELERKLSGTARDGLSSIAKAWQDLGNALTGSTDGWRSIVQWFANDFALALRNAADAINAVKDAWRAFKSGFSTEGGMQFPTMPGAVPQPVTPGVAAASPQATTATAEAIGKEIAQILRDEFHASENAIAGILGNVQRESGFRSNAYTIDSNGLPSGGLFQLNGPRYSAFSAANGGVAPNDASVGAQVRYAMKEVFADLNLRSMWGAMQGATPGSAASMWTRQFERPANVDQQAAISAANANQFAGGSGAAMVADARAMADAIAEQVKQTRALAAIDIEKRLDEVHRQMDAVAESTGKSSAQYRGLEETEAGLIAKQQKNVDEMEQAQRASESALRANQGLTEGEQALSAAIEARRQVALNAGLPFGDAQQQQATLEFLAKQGQAAEQLAASLGHTMTQSTLMARAYGEGNEAVQKATANQLAENEARRLYVEGSPQFNSFVSAAAASYRDVAKAAGEAQVAQKNLASNDNLDFIRAETDSLGTNEQARTRMLAVMKAEQEMHRQFGDLLPKEAQEYIKLAGATADATAAFQLQQNSLNEVKSFFSNTFDTIGNAITQAFATGNLAALKFKDIAKSVASAVVSEFAKLAVINPLKNLLTGGNDPTLTSVGGILGKIFGGSGAGGGVGESAFDAISVVPSVVAAGSTATSLFESDTGGTATVSKGGGGSASTSTSAAGGVGVLGGLSAIGSIGDILSKVVGGNGSPGLIGGFADKIVTGITNALGNTDVAVGIAEGVTPIEQSVSSLTKLAAGVANAAGASDATASAVASAAATVADAIPYIGTAIAIGTSLIKGDYRSAAFTAGGALAGAAIGSVFFGGPGVGTAIGALTGSLVSSLFPAHPLHPFDATAVNIQDGHLEVGKSATQAEAANSLGQAENFVTSVNTFMAKSRLVLDAAWNGQLGAIGQGISGMAGLVTDPNQLLAALRFKNDPTDTSQFGVAKGALQGMAFANGQDLQNEMIKIAAFADATEAIGVKLRAVGTDLTNIQVDSVSGANPSSTGTAIGPNGQSIQYLNDLRTALNNDLPQKTLANVEALDAEINSVNQFINSTIPGLLHPIESTTSDMMTQVEKTRVMYEDAISKSLQYGLDNTQVLRDAEEEAYRIIRRSGIQSIEATSTTLWDRLNIAQGGGQAAQNQQALHGFDTQAQQQRDQLKKLWTDTYGDAIVADKGYLDQINLLEQTLGAERVALVKQQGEAVTGAVVSASAAAIQSILDADNSLWARLAAARGDTETADLLNFDTKAAQERTSFSVQLLSTYGDAFKDSVGYAAQIALLEETLGAERVAIIQKYGGLQSAALKQAQAINDNDQSFWARLASANGDQKTADLINFDVKAGQERTSLLRTADPDLWPRVPKLRGIRGSNGAAGADPRRRAPCDHQKVRRCRERCHRGSDQAGPAVRRVALYQPDRLRHKTAGKLQQPALADRAIRLG